MVCIMMSISIIIISSGVVVVVVSLVLSLLVLPGGPPLQQATLMTLSARPSSARTRALNKRVLSASDCMEANLSVALRWVS